MKNKIKTIKMKVIISILILILIPVLINNIKTKTITILRENLKNANTVIMIISEKTNSEIGYKTENEINGSCNVAISTKKYYK